MIWVALGTWVFGALMVAVRWHSYTPVGRVIFPFIWPAILATGLVVSALLVVLFLLGGMLAILGKVVWTHFDVGLDRLD